MRDDKAEGGSPEALRVLFLVRALTVGGAEGQLLATASGLQRRGHAVQIAVFYAEDTPLTQMAAAQGIPVVNLRKSGRWDVLGFLRRLRTAIRRHRADLVYSYLPSANMASTLAAIPRKQAAIVWGVRSTFVGGASYDWLGHLVSHGQQTLARRADAIVVNSASGIEYHACLGWPRERMFLIRNGVDTSIFRFDQNSRRRLRASIGVFDSEPLVLLAGRHDPMKGIETFLHACRELPARMLIIGRWSEPYTTQLRLMAEQLGLSEKLVWLDRQDDMAGWMSAADVVCSSSVGEGTSNVLIEATACNACTVATDAGDSAEIVADSRRVARIADPEDLARALGVALAMLPDWNRTSSQHAILARYSIATMVAATETVLRSAAAKRQHT
jgi:glycosyltransferase involved in cell wall biosynthesis